ncbi:uncharacterized protein JCM6883_006669 [Sporobolomyces salmoneus]|uniref:uncharacterized protein n=1 Tax=Sporobolomyces salmoneus TaxID=183962 RepID=UPI00316CDF55
MDSIPSQTSAYQQPSFFPPSSTASFHSSPSSWDSLPRPRLKRARSTLPPPPNNSPQGPLSPALYTGSATPIESSSIGSTSASGVVIGIPLTRGRNGSGGLLEIIQEVPQAETLATSPVGRSGIASSVESSRVQPSLAAEVIEEDRPSKSKRRRVAPDHEAFGRLSLNYAPIPSNSTSTPFFPTSTSPPSASTSRGFLSSPVTSPTYLSFPAVPPTSPDFLPQHSSISPPTFSPLHVNTNPPILSSFPPTQTLMNPCLDKPVSHPAPAPIEHEIEMSPNGQSSWDLDPYRIYVASLSDDDDDSPEQAARRKKEKEEEEAERFRLNSLVASGLATPSRILDKRKKEDGALILYQPPPNLLDPTGNGKPEETQVERLRREERERKKEEEFQEFRRESERIEANDDDSLEGMEVEDTMEMEF